MSTTTTTTEPIARKGSKVSKGMIYNIEKYYSPEFNGRVNDDGTRNVSIVYLRHKSMEDLQKFAEEIANDPRFDVDFKTKLSDLPKGKEQLVKLINDTIVLAGIIDFSKVENLRPEVVKAVKAVKVMKATEATESIKEIDSETVITTESTIDTSDLSEDDAEVEDSKETEVKDKVEDAKCDKDEKEKKE